MSKLRLRETWPGILLILLGVIGLIYNGIISISAPKVMNETDIPEQVERIYARFDNLELIGYGYTDKRYVPNEKVSVTLYWRLIEPTDEDLTLSLTLINPYGDVINEQDEPNYPDELLLETSTWEVAQVYAVTYELPLVRTVLTHYPFSLAINLYDETPDMRVEPLNEADNPMTVELAMGAVIHPNIRVSRSNLQLAPAGNAPSRTFGGILRMDGFGYHPLLDELSFSVDVLWESQTRIEKEYTTFMHIIDEEGVAISQDDFQPQLPTSYWSFNEDFVLSYDVNQPEFGFAPGIYTVKVGWYELLYDEEADEYTGINLTIEPNSEDEIEIVAYEIFQFEVDADGIILLPALETENSTPLGDLQKAPLPPVRIEVTEEDE